jgi:hypothetical protein
VFGYLRKRRQEIRTVKYADDVVLLSKEETVLRGAISRIIEVGKGLGMQMVVEKLEH